MLEQANAVVPDQIACKAYKTAEEEWAEVLAVAPAMSRLPDMVADRFETTIPHVADRPAFRRQMHDRIQAGVVLMFRLVNNNINSLFEHYDVLFGSALDLLMEELDLEASAEDDSVRSYSNVEICGRMFAYLVMEIYCGDRGRRDEEASVPFDEKLLDMESGYYNDADPTHVTCLIAKVVSTVHCDAVFEEVLLEETTQRLYQLLFRLRTPSDFTVWH